MAPAKKKTVSSGANTQSEPMTSNTNHQNEEAEGPAQNQTPSKQRTVTFDETAAQDTNNLKSTKERLRPTISKKEPRNPL
jgi:hypothetical protein